MCPLFHPILTRYKFGGHISVNISNIKIRHKLPTDFPAVPRGSRDTQQSQQPIFAILRTRQEPKNVSVKTEKPSPFPTHPSTL